MATERINCKFCGFGVQSENDEELMRVIKTHNRDYHPDKNVPDDTIRQRIERI